MLIPYDEQNYLILSEFLEALRSRNLKYCARDFTGKALIDERCFEPAVHRAIRACSALGISPHDHFKKIYRIEKEGVTIDWKLSALAFNLTLLNADPINPAVANLQAFLLKKMA